MRTRTTAGRIAAAGLAVSVTALATTASAGGAATANGVGAGTVTTSVIDATLGDLVGLTLLQDVAGSTTDAKLGTVGATSTFRQLQLRSTVQSLNQVAGEHKVSAPQGPSDVTTAALDLSTLNLSGIVTGTVAPVLLKALSTPSSITSSTAKVTNLGMLGGLANVGVLNALDNTGSSPSEADAGRTMNLDALSLLDLGKLLQGLGLNVLDLNLSVVSGLVSSTGVPVDLKGATSLATLVTSLSQSISALLDSLDTTVTGVLLTSLQGTGLPVSLQPAVGAAIEGPTGAITTLQTTLTTLINAVVSLLEQVVLLKVNALDITTLAKAGDTVAGSAATAAGKVGSVQVGPVTVPGVDAAATTAAVNDLVAKVQAALNTVLRPLGFTDLLSLKLFDRQTGVTEASGVVKAVSSITGLVVKLTPPSVASLVEPPDPLRSHLPVPTQNGRVQARAGTVAAAAAPNPLDTLFATQLAGAPLLSKGLELKVGTVQSQSLHSAPAAPAVPSSPAPEAAPKAPTTPATATTPTGSLPRTGGEQTTLALVAMGFLASALCVRRLRRAIRP